MLTGLIKFIGFIGKYWQAFAAIGFGAFCFIWGWQWSSNQCEAEKKAAALQFAVQANQKSLAYEETIKRLHEKSRSNRERIIYETNKPDYHCIIPANGVQLYQSALSSDSR
jgi:hypothetical protein